MYVNKKHVKSNSIYQNNKIYFPNDVLKFTLKNPKLTHLYKTQRFSSVIYEEIKLRDS